MSLSNKTVPAENVAGQQVQFHVALLPQMQLGNTTVRNVVVMVADDKDLFVPEAKYQVNGIVGFPVLFALRRLTFTSHALEVGSRIGSAKGTPLLMDELTPLVAVATHGTAHLFSLDTGASRTILTARYAKTYANELSSAQKGVRQLTGVGGSRSVDSFKHVSSVLALGGASVRLTDVDVLRQPIGSDEDALFGILGRDVLRQFKSYTMDFTHMRFWAEPANSAR